MKEKEETFRKCVRLGRVVATPGALDALMSSALTPAAMLARHRLGDWGDVGDEDWRENDWAYDNAARILSVYALPTGEKVWVITEPDRSATTILLASEC